MSTMIVTVEPSTFGGEESAYIVITHGKKVSRKVMLVESVPEFLDRLSLAAERRGVEIEIANSL